MTPMPIVHLTEGVLVRPWTIRELIDAELMAMLEAHVIAFEEARRQIEAHEAKLAAMTKKERRHYLRLHNPPPRRGRR